MESGQNRQWLLSDPVDFANILSIELVLALSVLEFDVSLSHCVLVFGELN